MLCGYLYPVVSMHTYDIPRLLRLLVGLACIASKDERDTGLLVLAYVCYTIVC